MLAGNDRNLLQTDGYRVEMLQLAYHLMTDSLDMLDDATIEEGAEFFYKYLIVSHSYCDVDRSLRFQYDHGSEPGEVEIIFSENAGLEAIVEFLDMPDRWNSIM